MRHVTLKTPHRRFGMEIAVAGSPSFSEYENRTPWHLSWRLVLAYSELSTTVNTSDDLANIEVYVREHP